MGLLSAVLCLCCLIKTPLAASEAIHSIHTSVILDQTGDARITQTYDLTIARGTEWYLVWDNMDDMEIKDFSVNENNRTFTNVGEWDVDRTLDEKRNECGIVTKYDGYELCWGVGSYGRHTFTVSYTVTNLVKAYDDYDGFNVRFINDQMSSGVDSMEISIQNETAPLTPATTKVWAFGFTGQIHVENGRIACFSEKPLSTNNYCNIMARFDKGIFTPNSTRQGSFHAVVEEAFIGSDYDYDLYLSDQQQTGLSSLDMGEGSYGGFIPPTSDLPDWVFVAIFAAIVFIPILFIVCIVVLVKKVSKTMLSTGKIEGFSFSKAEIRHLPWQRDLPYQGDLRKTFYALKATGELKHDSDIIAALLLKWMLKGLITFQQTPAKTFLGLGKKTQPSIILPKTTPSEGFDSEEEEALFKILKKAGGKDAILQKKELYRYSKTHYTRIRSFLTRFERSGKSSLTSAGDIVSTQRRTVFGLGKTTIYAATNKGRSNASAMLSFRKYLQDFTLINERTVQDVALWDQYLIFASLFGIAEKVAKQFEDLYPQYFEDFNCDNDIFFTMAMIHSLSHASHSGMNAGRNIASASGYSGSSGGGGFSSGGGGGGFSGGGSGGGSR